MTHSPPQADQPSYASDFRAGVNWFHILANAHAACITMFIRHRFGSSLPGFRGVAALLMILTMLGQSDIRMLWFIEAWIAALIIQRL